VQKRFNWVNKEAPRINGPTGFNRASKIRKKKKEGLATPVEHPEGSGFNWAGKKAQESQNGLKKGQN
jgi:hypothetical protein